MKAPVRPLLRLRGGKLQAELPPLRKFQDAVQETFYPDVRELSRIQRATPTQLWFFDPTCYQQVARMVEHFWPGQTVDLVDEDPQPIPADDIVWDSRWSEWLRDSDQAQRAGARTRSPLEDFLRAFDEQTVALRTRTPFQVLHVTTDAPWEVVEAAHRALVKLYHTDTGGPTADVLKLTATRDAFLELKKRYGK